MNFSQGCYFAENRWNSRLIVKNMNFSRGWYFYKCAIILHKYSVISPKIDEICDLSSEYEFFSESIFYKWRFCLRKSIIILLNIGNIRYFLPLNVERNFPQRYFLNARFFVFFFYPLSFHEYTIIPPEISETRDWLSKYELS